MTAITGPNEAGKSYVIEMIRFGFFGSAALRGQADDYKTLKLEMEWSLKGKSYRVERKSGNAKLFENGEAIAVGVKPVNIKILGLLGFGLEVFDIACVCNQGEVEKLGNMKPAERKRMVDEVIGVDRIDEVTKWAGEQMTFANREIALLEKGLVEPEAPEEPADYRPSAELTVEFNEKKLLWDERNQLEGWLSHKRTEPVLPQDPGGHPIQELEAMLTAHRDWARERMRVSALPVLDYDPEALRASWAAFDLWTARVAFEKAHPRASHLIADLHDAEVGWAQWDEQIAAQMQLSKLKEGQTTTCPHCKTDFFLAHDAIQHAQDRLDALPYRDRPAIERKDIEPDLRRNLDWLDPATLARWEELKDAPEAPQPTLPRTKITPPAGAISPDEKARLLATTSPLPDPEGTETALRIRKAYEADQAVYDREIGAWRAWRAEADVKEARLAELADIGSTMAKLQDRCSRAIAFERDMQAFEEAADEYATRKAELDEKRVEAAGWKASKEFLAELRTRIKTYLVPSLSRVASHLLAQMTGGQRSSIAVDEDFEVMVDGQRLATLSGSGKACANLALRIGLGQVLTNNVLSLFIGDEIDASMDEERADFTQVSLQSLTQRISQILLITHKVPTADHVVTFEGGDGQADDTRSAA